MYGPWPRQSWNVQHAFHLLTLHSTKGLDGFLSTSQLNYNDPMKAFAITLLWKFALNLLNMLISVFENIQHFISYKMVPTFSFRFAILLTPRWFWKICRSTCSVFLNTLFLACYFRKKGIIMQHLIRVKFRILFYLCLNLISISVLCQFSTVMSLLIVRSSRRSFIASITS